MAGLPGWRDRIIETDGQALFLPQCNLSCNLSSERFFYCLRTLSITGRCRMPLETPRSPRAKSPLTYDRIEGEQNRRGKVPLDRLFEQAV